ncbi:L-lactate transport [Chthoniobacter flavus Ellin428]|uniref:L-lactate permease n=1 Tax=Chthoniobacter flavus Ellin428 TaxID=497964 RepID=B4CY67_9BACT|nr:L-lactate permease [Chthoniobacter flavus]EDY21215.1 L-lactate transport [Chthoniobacter flavus Ellin428]TCO87584.1 lactate permease [Chthoniobacter flavus]
MALWSQNYDPFGNIVLSTMVASIPIVILLGMIALLHIRIHIAAAVGLIAALAISVGVCHMPGDIAAAATIYGAAYGLFPIGWIILNVIFLYQLTVQRGLFDVVRDSLARVAPDARIQLILIAFAFGAFVEGMAGFGTPVAITAAILIQLGFRPLHASGLALIANTAPVAFGSLGIPITTLAQVSGLDVYHLSAMIGRQLPFFSLVIPFWIIVAFDGWRGIRAVWPAALTAGLAFAIPQFLVSNFHGPWLVDIIAGVSAIVATILLLRVWQPKEIMRLERPAAVEGVTIVDSGPLTPKRVAFAWMPWVVLTIFILCWGLPVVQKKLDTVAAPKFEVPHLHLRVQHMPPVAPPNAEPEKAIFKFNYLSATGSGILLAAIVAGFAMGFTPVAMLRAYGHTFWRVRFSLLTIAAMLSLGYVTKYAGTDATLGIALAHTGVAYPFFGTLLGWLGVALTGSDTASNVLFGGLQKITAQQLHLSPVLMGAANSAGGVMGKMVDAQSIVVASTATNWYGHEDSILRYVFWHSLALATLMGIFVYLQAYVAPFTSMVVK